VINDLEEVPGFAGGGRGEAPGVRISLIVGTRFAPLCSPGSAIVIGAQRRWARTSHFNLFSVVIHSLR